LLHAGNAYVDGIADLGVAGAHAPALVQEQKPLQHFVFNFFQEIKVACLMLHDAMGESSPCNDVQSLSHEEAK